MKDDNNLDEYWVVRAEWRKLAWKTLSKRPLTSSEMEEYQALEIELEELKRKYLEDGEK